MTKKITQIDSKILLIAVIFAGIILFAINFKEKFHTFDKNYIELSKKIQELKQIDYEIQDLLKESIIHLRFNNDTIVENIREHREYLNHFLSLEDDYPEYSQSFKYLNQHKKAFEKNIDNIYRFMQYNARIGNSLLYLQNEIQHLDKYENKFKQNIMKILSSFMNAKQDFRNKYYVDSSMMEYFNNYKTSNISTKLTISHLQLLHKEIPKYKNVFNKIETSEEYILSDKMKESLQIEANAIDQQLQTNYTILLIFLIIASITILFFMTKSSADEKKLLLLTKENEKRLKYDPLTTVKSRSAFMQSVIAKDNLPVLLLDIQNFSKVNAIVGYNNGDKVLEDVALILKKFGEVFRLASDQFAIILNNKDMEKLANKISLNISEHRFSYDDFELPVSVNIGATQTKPYIKTAEQALTIAKKSNKNVMLYTEDMDDTTNSKENIDMLKKVNYALQNNNIRPFFQPLISLKTKEIVKYESLVRLIDNDKPISPYFFLDLTKGSRSYQSITKIVMERSLEIIQKENIPVSINISFEDIEDKETTEFIVSFLNKNKTYSHMITFELLESESIGSFELVNSFIQKVKNFGSQIAIDDFGSGYSNFEYLFKLQPDILKIDGSLIKDIDSNERSKIIVESILHLAKKSNIETVAEFVDKEEIHNILCDLGIDYGQGYLYSEPKDLLG